MKVLALVGVALALGCGLGTPDTFEGCAAIRDGIEREECRFLQAQRLSADPAALAAALATLSDATGRDLLLVRLAMDAPDKSDALCGQVTTPAGKQRCQQILGRPHLRGRP